jgi:thiol:disulfide interchange protein
MTKIIQIPFLNYDLRPQSQPDRQRGYVSSAMMGVFFSAGWAPCVGPVLGAILTLSFNQGSFTQGAGLLTAYSAGLAIPFLLAATQIGWVTTVIRRYGKVMHYAEIVMGIILIVLGVMLFSGQFQIIAIAASVQIAFESADAEFAAGKLLLAAAGIIIVVGLIPGLIARARGLNFVDYWFLGMGATLILMLLLYFFGAFNGVIPLLS